MNRISIIIIESPDNRHTGLGCRRMPRETSCRVNNPRQESPEEKLLKKIFGECHEDTEHRH